MVDLEIGLVMQKIGQFHVQDSGEHHYHYGKVKMVILFQLGSINELTKLSGIQVTDLHRETIDNIIINKNGKKYYNLGLII
jgi:hypothetical protein